MSQSDGVDCVADLTSTAADVTSEVASDCNLPTYSVDSNAADLNCASKPEDQPAELTAEHVQPSVINEASNEILDAALKLANEGTVHSAEPGDKTQSEQAYGGEDCKSKCDIPPAVDLTMPSNKARGGRSYQESRRSKKPGIEKTRSGTVGAKYDRACADDRGLPADLSEQKGKGDVQDQKQADRKSLQQNPSNVLRHEKEQICRPTCDGDPPASVNVIAEERKIRKGGEDLLNLIKQSPSNPDKRQDGKGKEGGAPSGSRSDLRHKAKPATELEAQWRKEADTKKLQEDEEQRKEEERQRQLEEAEKLERERKEQEEAEAQRLMDEELKSIQDFINETRDRIDSKSALRDCNLNAAENRPDESFFVKLDSNLKKNTAFVKKLRNLTETQKDALVKDFNSLNLTMYVGEMADAIVEARLKMSDIGCALTLCSLMHQRYAEFSSLLLEGWHKVLLSKKDDKVPNASKLRVDLRLFADLVAAGVFTEKEGLSVLATQITLLTANDRDEHNNLPIILSFCKHCGDDYAGLVPRKFRLLAEKYNVEIPRSQLLKGDRQKACRNLLKDYFTSLCKHLLSDCKELRNLEKQNRRILQTKGELSNERKEKYEASQVNFQKLLQNAQMLADLLDEDLPQLPKEEPKSDLDGFGLDALCVSKGGTEFEPEGDLSLYDDDDTRQFYENIPDLKAIIPGILYKDSEHAASLVAELSATTEEELDDDDIELLAATEGTDVDLKAKTAADVTDVTADTTAVAAAAAASAAAAAEAVAEAVADQKKDAKKDEELLPDYEAVVAAAEIDEDDGDVASSMKVMLETYLNNLSNCVNRELIDKAAVEFCMNLNTKMNRRKLVRALFFVHRTRYDLLPFYARLVATLHPCMPSVATDLALMLKTDFKYHVRKKDQINIESKLKSVRFIGELVKFNMFAKSEALHCLKMLLFDFKHHNIEMACGLLETCGRYLYRTAESHQRVKIYLEVMMRKKAALHLDSRYTTMIENAYYYSNPPESRPEQRVQRPPMFEYIRKLLYKDLSKTSIERVLRQMRKLDWDSIEVRRYATKSLTEVHNLRYNNIHCCANLLAGLAPYQEAVGIQVTDGVIEDIKLWLEVNHPKYNQQRVSSVHYLGELYNYRMVESQVIFRTLYLFITFGVSLDDAVTSVLDPPEHLFRIRLVCVLLETCGQYFDRGSSKKKLDCFLVYFQRYYWFKKKNAIWSAECPFPRDVEYLFYDTLELLRPKLHICVSWEEASQAADALDKEFSAKLVELVKVNNSLSQQDSGSLSAIQETDEHDGAGGGLTQLTNENTTQDDSDQEGDQMHSNSQSLSQKDGTYEEHCRTGRRDDDENTGQDYVGSADEEEIVDSAGESDDEEATHAALKHVKCQEDDDFLAAFDKMMSETLQARSQDLTKIPVVDIAVPLSIKTQPKPKPPTLNILSSASPASPVGQATSLSQGHAASLSQGQADDEAVADSHGDITFTLLSRKGNKPQFATVHIPSSESFAAKFIEQMELEKMEKERMKRVVLNMHERQEEEDYQEMIAQMNRPLPLNINRDRRVPYQHPKGAPDADVIFGSKKR